MRDWIPSLVKALDHEIAAAQKEFGVRTVRLIGGEPREPGSHTRPGVSAIWYRIASPLSSLPDELAFARVRIGNSDFDCAILDRIPERVLLSIEHANSSLGPIQNAELILDPTELLRTLQSRLREAEQGIWNLNWPLLQKAAGSLEPRVSFRDEAECELDDLSAEQARAVRQALGSEVTFIQGPPGTGKTHTAARIIASALKANQSILVTSHTHVAIDQALMACVNGSLGRSDPRLARLGQPRLPIVPKNLVANTVGDLPETAVRRGATFATLAKVYVDEAVLSQAWDYVLIDELSMVNAALAMMAMGRARYGLILVGDPHQLPPITQAESKTAKVWLGTDLFERCNATSRESFTRLTVQHRMKPEIADIARTLRYGGDQLIDADETKYRSATLSSEPLKGAPLSQLYVPGATTFRYDGSYWNLESAILSAMLATSLVVGTGPPAAGDRKPVGIITPYRAQSRLITRFLSSIDVLDWVRPGTVHTFQGDEADIVLFDATLSHPVTSARIISEKSANDAKRLLNVAVTRARDSLVFVNNPTWVKKNGRRGALGLAVKLHFHRAPVLDLDPPDLPAKWRIGSLTAVLNHIRPERVAWLAQPDRRASGIESLVSGWVGDGVDVYAMASDSHKPLWVTKSMTWMPWSEPPQFTLTDQGVAVNLGEFGWVSVKDQQTAELVGTFLSLTAVTQQLYVQPECRSCGRHRRIEISRHYVTRGTLFIGCSSSSCKARSERVKRHTATFGANSPSPSEPKGRRTTRHQAQRKPKHVRDSGKTATSSTAPRTRARGGTRKDPSPRKTCRNCGESYPTRWKMCGACGAPA